ncbi:MAG: molecular chaperone GroEL, partial [Bdellovibrionales bacterium]|nr:molecular chaperone GroEL [Massilia sp.]
MASISFGGTYRELLVGGLYDSVKSVKSGMAVWFVLFGVLLFIVGMLISDLEKNKSSVSKSVGVALLMLTTVGVLMMPISGFWLMF